MRLFLVGLVALIVGLLAGAAPLYLQLRAVESQAAEAEEQLQRQLAETQRNLAISDVHSRLAMLLMHVQRSEFTQAQQASTGLYDRVDGALASLEEGDDRRRLLTLKDTRDEVTAKLAVADASVAQTLERLFTLISASLQQ
jgi:hypothetical protein